MFRLRHFPHAAIAKPVIRRLELFVVINMLAEDTVFLADAITVSRNSERGHGIQKTSRQSTQTAIAQARIPFQFFQFTQVKAHLPERRLPLVKR